MSLFCYIFLSSIFILVTGLSINEILYESTFNEKLFLWKERQHDDGILAEASMGEPKSRHIILFKNNFQSAETQSLLNKLQKTINTEVDEITFEAEEAHITGAFALKEGTLTGIIGEFTQTQLKIMRDEGAVRLIEEDTEAEIASIEPMNRSYMWGLQQNPPSWGLSEISGNNSSSFRYPIEKGRNVRVYVIDTGIDGSLPSFESRIEAGWSIFERNLEGGADSPLIDEHGHGTHVAGIIGGKDTGVAKEASIISVRVFRQGTGPVSNVIAGLAWILSQKSDKERIDLVNLSITSMRSIILNSLLESSWKANLVVIAAAGNQGTNACLVSPAASVRWIVSVGAYCQDRRIASFSNRGKKCVHVYAPGCHIFSLVSGAPGTLISMNGTSMAAPHVTGVAALLLSTLWMKEKIRNDPERLRTLVIDKLSLKNLVADEHGQTLLSALSLQHLYRFFHRKK